MAIGVGDVLRVGLSWLVNSADEQANVHTLQVQAKGGGASDADILDEIVNTLLPALYSNVTGLMSNNVVGSVVSLFNLSQGIPYAPLANPIDGSSAVSDALPYQVAALCFMNGATPHRQARVYLPVSVEIESLDSGFWSGGAQTSLTNFVADWLLPMVGTDCTVQRVIATQQGTNPIVPSYGGFATSPRTQRRRTPGRGS